MIMKKVLLLTLFTLLSITKINAQTSVGGGLLLGSYTTAIEVNADFGVSEQISISPSIDYYLVGNTYGSNVTMYLLGLDGHYNLGDNESFNYYPLLGLNYFSVSFSGEGYNFSYGSGIGLTAGGGGTYALSESIKLYGELKYIRSGIGFSAGIMFSL